MGISFYPRSLLPTQEARDVLKRLFQVFLNTLGHGMSVRRALAVWLKGVIRQAEENHQKDVIPSKLLQRKIFFFNSLFGE